MSDSGKGKRPDDVVRAEAIAWLNRLRSSTNAEQHGAFEDWYAADTRHADIYDDVLANWDSTALAARTPAGENRVRLDAPPKGHPFRSQIAIAAALVLAIIAGLNMQRLGMFGDSRPAATQIASKIGEIRTVALPDGSRVTLDTNSGLEVVYTSGERRLVLDHGRARFEVAHDANRPFIVGAGSGTVIAHGTVFDVDVQGPGVTVSLLRGSVEVRSHADSGSGNKGTARLLRPGQRLSLEEQGSQNVPMPLHAQETRWPSGMLSFDDARLAEVVAAVNRYSTARIILADPAIGNFRFTGTFKARDVQGFARMVTATFNLGMSEDENGNLLLALRSQ